MLNLMRSFAYGIRPEDIFFLMARYKSIEPYKYDTYDETQVINKSKFRDLCRNFEIISRNFKILSRNFELVSKFRVIKSKFRLIMSEFRDSKSKFQDTYQQKKNKKKKKKKKNICGPNFLSYIGKAILQKQFSSSSDERSTGAYSCLLE